MATARFFILGLYLTNVTQLGTVMARIQQRNESLV